MLWVSGLEICGILLCLKNPNDLIKMNKNHNQASKEKGLAFENYVETVLFPKEDFDLLHKTSGPTQNDTRFVGSSLKPDFKFKCRVTNIEFWVEAKFRSKTFKNRYDILSDRQYKTFPKAVGNGEKIIIAFGYGGTADQPNHVSLFTLQKDFQQKFSPEELFHYDQEKSPVTSKEVLAFFISENEIIPESKNLSKTHSESEANQEQPIEELGTIKVNPSNAAKPKNRKFVAISLGVVGLIILFLSVFFLAKPNEPKFTEEHLLKEQVVKYYNALNDRDYATMINILNPIVDNWYGVKKMPAKRIVEKAKENLEVLMIVECIVDLNTIKVNALSDGRYYVTFNMMYRKRKTVDAPYQATNLKMMTYWDEAHKLERVTELRL